jgi:hypothetical protein
LSPGGNQQAAPALERLGLGEAQAKTPVPPASDLAQAVSAYAATFERRQRSHTLVEH